MKKILILLALIATVALPASATHKFTLVKSNCNNIDYQYDETTGEYTFTTTGGDPYVYTSALTRALHEGEDHLYLEYKCDKTITEFKLYYGNQWAENRSKEYGNLKAGEGWQVLDVSIAREIRNFNFGASGQKLRLDFGTKSGMTVMVRNVRIYDAMNEEEKLEEQRKQSLNNNLTKYLSTEYPCKVDFVKAESTMITIEGHCDRESGYKLVEIPMYANVTEDATFVFEADIEGTEFSNRYTRFINRNGFRYDRALSKWAIVDVTGETPVLASHARYPEDIKTKSSPKQMPLLGKKGLGGFFVNQFLSDLDEMQIHSVTVNMVLNQLIAISPGVFGNPIEYSYAGKTYYINTGQVNNFDKVYKECYKRGIVTSAILLVTPSSPDPAVTKALVHPSCEGGYYSIANTSTIEGVNCYAAIISFLASRYNSSTYGRINNWILHNEVDYATTWTNMGGDQPVMNYMDAYLKSMRLVHNIACQYDPNTWVLGSYTHSWQSVSSDGPGYSSYNMLSQTVKFSRAEGDFRWGVAYHPYPENLTLPEFWVNDTHSTYQMSSQYCTFKNLEVVNCWIQLPENLYQGNTKRLLFLSENGTNSPDYSAKQLELQAAGACWAWKKVNRLPGIDGIQWHNWFDNREEFGLRIGLRRYSDDETAPSGCKPVWDVWKAADTDDEEAVFKPYLKTLGLSSWERIFHAGTLTGLEEIQAEQSTVSFDQPTRIYTPDGMFVGTQLNGLPHGIYIVRQGAHSHKVLR